MSKKTILIKEEDIKNIIEKSEIITTTVFEKCTVVACKLPNGFVIVESSACVDKKGYSEEIGAEICMAKIEDKILELEGYILQNLIANGIVEE